MKDGIIETDTVRSERFGFSSDIFGKGSYLWKKDNCIWMSMIIVKEESRRQGHFKRLVKTIEDQGFRVKIPTPMPQMLAYLEKYGWKKTTEIVETPGGHKEPLEVWIR